jgi:hypothetical protein
MHRLTLATCFLVAACFLSARAAEPAMTLLADTHDFEEPASTHAHGFSTTGTVRVERIET